MKLKVRYPMPYNGMVKDMGSDPVTYLCDSGQVFNISINNMLE